MGLEGGCEGSVGGGGAEGMGVRGWLWERERVEEGRGEWM